MAIEGRVHWKDKCSVRVLHLFGLSRMNGFSDWRSLCIAVELYPTLIAVGLTVTSSVIIRSKDCSLWSRYFKMNLINGKCIFYQAQANESQWLQYNFYIRGWYKSTLKMSSKDSASLPVSTRGTFVRCYWLAWIIPVSSTLNHSVVKCTGRKTITFVSFFRSGKDAEFSVCVFDNAFFLPGCRCSSSSYGNSSKFSGKYFV